MKKIVYVLMLTLFMLVTTASGSIDSASRIFKVNRWKIDSYPEIIENLVSSRYYFSAVPFLKEYLIRGSVKSSKQIDRLLDEVVRAVGIMQFEVMPSSSLRNSRSPMAKYIVAKKMFRRGKYKEALSIIRRTIPMSHPVKPYALHLQGTIYALLKDYSNAKFSYEECVERSEDALSSVKYLREKRQLEMNRDYCTVGIARNLFTKGKYGEAEQAYLDIEKSSLVWPEILFDEAWTSFYLQKYNRTLGKLVTYKSPFFSHIFNPEIEVLEAMTYLHMCLWGDARHSVDEFYKKYENQSKRIKSFLRRKGKNYKGFFELARISMKKNVGGNSLLNKMLKNLTYDPAYIELTDIYERGLREIQYVKKLRRGRFKNVLLSNLKDVLFLQRDLIGAYIRKGLRVLHYKVDQTFEHMSYIKLEVIRHKKEQIYSDIKNSDRERGDVNYLKRSSKQYFWTFNGEFWADELGDYVFALRSECN
jgi:tetratricopeptide (TPR) repeat protein